MNRDQISKPKKASRALCSFFRIADFSIKVCYTAGDTCLYLLPSMDNFKGNATDDLLFTLTIDKTTKPTAKNRTRRIKVFDTGNGDIIIDEITGGGYQFVIKDTSGRVCCLLKAGKDFSSYRCALNGNSIMKSYGLNNAFMLAFAFSSSFHQTLLMHASVVRHKGFAYAFTAKSGTGKSYQAINLCREKNIESIIDDGLYIIGNNVAAGISAKRQSTKVGAIKTALFTDEEHRRAVMEKIAATAPGSILILGTSLGMVEKIRETLGLPEISEYIDINDITTEAERETAGKQRKELGKHVIPVPSFALKRQFSGYFLDPLRMFKGRSKQGAAGEKSVVRPTYSYLGEYIISEKVISDIAHYVCARMPEVASVVRVTAVKREDGIQIELIVFLRYGHRILDAARLLQRRVTAEIEQMTAFNVEKVDIEVRGLKGEAKGVVGC